MTPSRQSQRIAWSVSFALLAATSTAAPDGTLENRTFENGPITLAADLLFPQSLGDPTGSSVVPGVVVVHGSGDSDRRNPWTRAWADALVARGVAVLHPDKRGCGDSGGTWLEADFADLAADAIAGLEILRGDPRVDPKRVGLVGFSQGGHIVPIAALESDHVAFAISISGSVVPLLEQIRDELTLEAENARLAPDATAALLAVHDLAVDVLAKRRPFEDYEAALAALGARADLPSALVDPFPTSNSDPRLDWMRKVGNPDPITAWRDAATPALFVYGTSDDRIRVAKSTQRILDRLDPKSTPYDLILLGGNGHALFRDDAADFVARWIVEGASR